MDMNEKFKRALELQEEGIDRKEIYKELDYQSMDSFTKMMKKFGYKYDKSQLKYVQVECVGQVSSGDEENTISTVVQKQTPVIKNLGAPKQSSIIDLKNEKLKENLLEIAEHREDLMELLKWYKTQGGQVSFNKEQVIELVQQGIKIDLPKCESIKTSIRVNKEVWKQFGEFAELHHEFVKGDLLAQALKEYMNKHE